MSRPTVTPELFMRRAPLQNYFLQNIPNSNDITNYDPKATTYHFCLSLFSLFLVVLFVCVVP